MTIITFNIDDKHKDIIDIFITIASKFNGIHYKVKNDDTETEEEVLNSFKEAMKSLKSGRAIKEAKPIDNLLN